jgi:hypothetical protein
MAMAEHVADAPDREAHDQQSEETEGDDLDQCFAHRHHGGGQSLVAVIEVPERGGAY